MSKSPAGWLVTAVVTLVLLTAAAPLLIQLSQALLPLVIVLAVAVVVVRLAFFHTRNF